MSNEANNHLGIRYIQQQLNLLFSENLKVDGEYGQKTKEAIDRAFGRVRVGQDNLLAKAVGTKQEETALPKLKVFDERSERNLNTLQPHVEKLARKWLGLVRNAKINMVVICGTRTFAEQDELYAQGRTKAGRVVTNTRSGASMHNYGLAWDAVLIHDGVAMWEGDHLRECGWIAESLGIEWGGYWKSFKDSPHYQFSSGMSITALRSKYPQGWIPA